MRKITSERLEDRRMLATLVVNSDADTLLPVNDGDLTLREAIQYVSGEVVPSLDRLAFDFANLGTNDRIVFDDSVFGSGPGQIDTIELLHGELSISNSVEINGADGFGTVDNLSDLGWSGLTIDAGANGRVLSIGA